ncbi:hypothetical protein AYO42_00930 [Rhizomicrobium sp. SCGC AG-212-E05]|nr:hypothetical protein AYO42_00930 [Rhizomicrobium sp. SCGC AG-212-E05]
MLAFFAVPRNCKPDCEKPDAKETASEDVKQIAFVKAQNKQVKVVVLPYADHYIFMSNEAQVLREMKTFLNRMGR